MKASISAVRVLTVRQPYACLLIHGSPSAGIKDVENRSKPTSHRGTLLIQASAKVDQAAYAEYIAEGIELPPAGDLVTGAIIGSVKVIGCVRDSRSGGRSRATGTGRQARPASPTRSSRSRDSYRCSTLRTAGRPHSAGPAKLPVRTDVDSDKLPDRSALAAA